MIIVQFAWITRRPRTSQAVTVMDVIAYQDIFHLTVAIVTQLMIIISHPQTAVNVSNAWLVITLPPAPFLILSLDATQGLLLVVNETASFLLLNCVDYLCFTALCRNNCAIRVPSGGCTQCLGDFDPPDCCNCKDNLTNIGGICSKYLHGASDERNNAST